MRHAGRIFMTLSILAAAAAVTYALSSKELAGSVMLGVFSVALLYIASTLERAAVGDRAENEPDAPPELGPEHSLGGSWWPILMAMGAGAILFGLKFQLILMAVGIAVFLLAALGWFVQAGRHAEERAQHGGH